MTHCREHGLDDKSLKLTEPEFFIDNIHTEKESMLLAKFEEMNMLSVKRPVSIFDGLGAETPPFS